MMMNLGFLRGLNFNNMNMTSIAIENKLNNPKTTLEDLLIEEDLIQEFRNSNEKLIKFFDNENIKKLVNYIILEPKEDDQIKGHKFPFVASEILSCEEKHIYNRFLLTEDELIQENENENDHINLNSSHEMKDFLDKNIISDDKKEDNDQSNHDNNNHDLLTDTEKQNKMDLEQTEQETKKDEEKKEEKEEAKKDQEKKDEETKKEEKKDEEKKEEKKDEEKKDEETKKEETKKDEEKKEEKEETKKEEETKKDEEKKKEEKYPKNRIELLDYLLSFLETENELNYVLTGYFCKFLSALLSYKPNNLIVYLFIERSDILEKFVFHSYRKSLSIFLSKLLLYENEDHQNSLNNNNLNRNPYENNTNNNSPENSLFNKFKDSINKKKLEIIEKIFELIKISSQPEKISSLVLLLSEILDNKQIFKNIISSKNIFQNLFNELKTNLNSVKNSNIKTNYTEILNLINNILTIVQKNKEKTPKYETEDDIVEQGQTNKKISHTPLSEFFFSSFDFIINNYKQENDDSHKIKTTFDDFEFVPLGLHRVKIVELLSNMFYYLKNVSDCYDRILIKSEFFTISFEYLFKYEWNNFFQNSLLNLFKNYLKDGNFHTELSTYLFENLQLKNVLKLHIVNSKEENKDLINYTFKSSNKITHGYIPFLISLSYKINSVIGGNPLLLTSRSREGSICFQNKSENEQLYDIFRNNFGDSNNSEKEKERKSNVSTTIESLKKYMNDDWLDFFNKYIADNVKLYEQKLCDNKSFINNEDEEDLYKKEENNPFNNNNKDDQFFASDDDNRNSGTDWLNNKTDDVKNEKVFEEVNLNDFEFVDMNDENKNNNNNTENLIVDELDENYNKQYNDNNYWKRNYDNNIKDEALKDLNL